MLSPFVELAQGLRVCGEVSDAVGVLVDVVGLQETFELRPRTESEEPAGLECR